MRFLIVAFGAGIAFAQASQALQLTQNENGQDLQEMSFVLRQTADIEQVTIDEAKRALTVVGTADRIATAVWLIQQLDIGPKAPFSNINEYRPLLSDDVVRVLYHTRAGSPQVTQEIVTTISLLTRIGQQPGRSKLYICNPLSA